jgi:hypothetical protein
MRICIAAALLACAGLSGPGGALAQGTNPVASARATQLRDIATLFVPAGPMSDMMIGGIEVTYRDRLESRDDIQALETAYPGIRAAMLAAATRSVRAGAPDAIARLQAEVIGYWEARLSPADAAAFAAFANDPTITGYTRVEVPMQRGDTATAAVRRATASAAPDAAYYRRAEAFGRTAAGRRLLPQISAYQASVGPRIEAAVHAVIRPALAEGRRAANARVRASNAGAVLPFDEE